MVLTCVQSSMLMLPDQHARSVRERGHLSERGSLHSGGFLFQTQKLVIEVDGSAHYTKKGYDKGGDVCLLRVYGI